MLGKAVNCENIMSLTVDSIFPEDDPWLNIPEYNVVCSVACYYLLLSFFFKIKEFMSFHSVDHPSKHRKSLMIFSEL